MNFFFNGLVAIGIFFGISLVIALQFFTSFFGPTITPSNQLMSTLLGAAIALAGTVLTIHASMEAVEKDREAKDQALISEVFVKFQAIANNFFHFRKHIRESFESIHPASHENPGLFVQALASHPEPIHFSSQEKALFLRRKNVALANDIGEWDGIHNSLLRSLEKYAELRQRFTESVPAKMKGTVGTTELSSEEFDRIAPLLAQMNQLIYDIRPQTEFDYPKCVEAVMRIRDAMQEICGIKVEITFPE